LLHHRQLVLELEERLLSERLRVLLLGQELQPVPGAEPPELVLELAAEVLELPP
jgi:hypothetical protein